MSDVVIKTPSLSQRESAPNASKSAGETKVSATTDVEVPYTSYKSETGSSLVGEYFELGTSESEFSDEISAIESYFTDRVTNGGMANSPKVIKEAIKKMEKLSGIDQTERTTLKVAKLAAYIKFLKETEDIDRMVTRYD